MRCPLTILPHIILFPLTWGFHNPHDISMDSAQWLMENQGHGRHLVRSFFGGDTSYAPDEADCPENQEWLWTADHLSKGEEKFLKKREKVVKEAVKKMMDSQQMPAPPQTPVIGYAISGGGYRAMITGLGGLMGLMKQSEEAVRAGTGGWADAITYMAGLSGGSWGTASWISNGGMLPLDMIEKVWNLESNLILPDDGKLSFYSNLIRQVDAKRKANFPAQLTDYWALALGEQLLPEEYRMKGHADLTISSLPKKVKKLSDGELPMPIIIASQREEGEYVIAQSATVWESTPYSFGSWAFGSKRKTPGGFTPVEYLGTTLDNAQAKGQCWKGLDRLAFIMGTSATLFNGLLLELNGTNSDNIIVTALKGILHEIGEDNFDVARIPNTFKGWDVEENPLKDFDLLTLVDAGETDQNIPLEPLLVPERNLDAIITFDASRQTETSWPNGSSIHTTSERAVILDERDDTRIKMPKVPTANGFINGGLNTRPTFFGCENTTTPLIVYIPQFPWTYYSNKSTFQLDFDLHAAKQTMLNGMRSLTLNSTVPTWPKCLSCALTDRAFAYTSQNRTDECKKCFDDFCWDGTSNDSTPPEYKPVLGVPDWLENKGLVDSRYKDGKEGTNNWKDDEASGLKKGGFEEIAKGFMERIGLDF
ncbi:uncharacterized protein L199_001713 [Kwoniella botswanensis]|uniref:uncharacterized protein n=1 Tax=Kwoniella botswanensis TaxID=1268659 RepID=UPI00315C9C59